MLIPDLRSQVLHWSDVRIAYVRFRKERHSMASFVRLSTVFVVAMAATAGTSFAQILLDPAPAGNPPDPKHRARPPVHPAYWYTDRDASLRFDVTPKDAVVYVDGRRVGLVDNYDGTFQRLRTAPGTHEVTVYRPGYRTYSRRTYLSVDKTATFRHSMQQVRPGEISEPPLTPHPTVR